MYIMDDWGDGTILEGFVKIGISLVSGIYKIVGYAYQIFMMLANNVIFDSADFNELVGRIYAVLGVVIMFILAYNFLNYIIDPDKNKGASETWKLLQNIVVSLVLIAICPSVFNLAMNVQKSVLNGNVIGDFFSTKTNTTGEDSSLAKSGRRMAVGVFSGFLSPENETIDTRSVVNLGVINKTLGDSDSGLNVDCMDANLGTCTLGEVIDYAIETGDYSGFKAFAANVVDKKVEKINTNFTDGDGNSHEASDFKLEFNFLIAIVAGCYLGYCIISFCFDMAVRISKMVFFEIIAPLCIAARILPKWDDMFKKWYSNVVKTYLSVFIRVIILMFGVYLINHFLGASLTDGGFFKTMDATGNSAGVKMIANVFVILGVITFVQQAPKLIDDIFGLGKDVKFGIKDKLKESKALAIGGALGAGTTSLVRNFTHTRDKVHDAHTKKEKWEERIKGIGRIGTSTIGGIVRGAKAGNSANVSWKGLKDAAKKGSQEQIEAREKRERYRAEHSIKIGDKTIMGSAPIIGGLATAINHIKDDFGTNIPAWAGYNNLDEHKQTLKLINDISNSSDQLSDAINAMIEKEAFKESSDFRDYIQSIKGNEDLFTNYTTAYEALQQAQAKGENVTQRKKEFDTAQKAVNKAVTRAVTVDDKSWNSLLTSEDLTTRKAAASMGSLRLKEEALRAALKDGLESDFAKQMNEDAIQESLLAVSPTAQKIYQQMLDKWTEEERELVATDEYLNATAEIQERMRAELKADVRNRKEFNLETEESRNEVIKYLKDQHAYYDLETLQGQYDFKAGAFDDPKKVLKVEKSRHEIAIQSIERGKEEASGGDKK